MENKPVFIVIEGVDGSGKSTQIELLKERIKSLNLKVLDTFEPTDGPVGGLIRNIMKRRILTDQSTIAALFLADRLDHINNPVNGMRKYYEAGFNIICSRYYFSSFAFQSEYVPIEWLFKCHELCRRQFKPDLTLYLEIPPKKSIRRLDEGRVEKEIYENYEKTRAAHLAYLQAFEKYGSKENIHIINGDQSKNEIADEIWELVKKVMKISGQ